MKSNSIIDDELPKLKALANALLAAEAPEIDVLDQIAALSSGIAARWRDATRRRLMDQVVAGGGALIPAGGGDLPARLAGAPLDELSGLAELVDAATVAQAAFERTDADLMAARERGEYAAMAPLAIEADSHRTALAAATAAFAERVGQLPTKADELSVARDEPETADQPGAASDAVAAAAAPEGEASPAVLAADEPELAPMLDAAEAPSPAIVDFDRRPTSQAERRRIRDLIRQMRTPEEAS